MILFFTFPGRTRTKDKYRVVYSDHQRLELEKEFHYSRYITIRRKAELAQALNLSERQVSLFARCIYLPKRSFLWYHTRRANKAISRNRWHFLKHSVVHFSLLLFMYVYFIFYFFLNICKNLVPKPKSKRTQTNEKTWWIDTQRKIRSRSHITSRGFCGFKCPPSPIFISSSRSDVSFTLKIGALFFYT